MRTINAVWAMAVMMAGCSAEPQPADPSPSPEPSVPGATVDALPSTPAPPVPSPVPASSRPAAASEFPDRFQALGTEPFWSIAVDAGTATFSTPEDIPGKSTTVVRDEAGGSLRLTGTLAEGPLRLVVSKGTCSDGMSDTVYPYTATVTVGSRALTGCARPGLPRRATG